MTDYTEALHKLADLIDANAATFEGVSVHADNDTLSVFTNGWGSADQDKRDVAAVLKAIGGTWEKEASDSSLKFEQSYVLGYFDTVVYANRAATCVRKVVGTERVVVPAVEAAPARVEELEIVEWDCGSLLAPKQVAA